MAAPTPGRRERLRRATLRELEEAALAEVRDHGGVGLSLRAVARRMGMSPAGLYRYVDSRDDLLTLLITRGYDDLADHVLGALGRPDGELFGSHRPRPDPPMVAGDDADVADRLRAVALAYRHWGVTHRSEFGLVFGDPIPGYAAPPGGPTVAAMTRLGLGLGRPLIEAWQQGRLVVPEVVARPELTQHLAPMAELLGDAPLPLGAVWLLAWGRLHGQVSLEVFGHHAWLFPDGCEPLFRAELESLLVDLGVVPAGGGRRPADASPEPPASPEPAS